MVNDMEDPKMQNGINQHTQAWADEMRRLGYSNLMYYTSASWLDQIIFAARDRLIHRIWL